MGRLVIRTTLTWLLLVLLCGVGGEAFAQGPATYFKVQPSSPTVTAGTYFTVTVTAYDAAGAVATGYNGSPTFTTSEPDYYCGSCTTTFSGGVGTLGLYMGKAGRQTLTFTDGSITGTGRVNIVGGLPSSVTVSAPATVNSGAPFTFKVTAYDGGGNVSSYSGYTLLSSSDPRATLPPPTSANLTNGVGTFQATMRTLGNQSITAQVPGSDGFLTGTTTLKVAPPKAVPGVSLAASSTSPLVGTPVTFTATVSGGISPTGTITFKDGSTVLGVVPLSGSAGPRAPAPGGSTAKLTTSSLSVGVHVVVAVYSGDPRNNAETSAPVSVDVRPRATTTRTDPTTDTDVVGLVAAEVETSTQFSQTQISNTSTRLDQIHSELDIPAFCPPVDRRSLSNGEPPRFSPAPPGGANQTAFGGLEQASQTMAYASGPSYLTEQSAAGQAIGALTSQMPAAFEALDKNGDLPFHIWSSASVAFGAVNSDGVGYDDHFTNAGLTIGFDRSVAEGLTMGVAFGGGLDNSSVGTDGTKLTATNFDAEVYGSYRVLQHTFIDAIAGYGVMRFDLKRWSQPGDVMLDGSRGGSDIFGSVGVTQQFEWDELKVAPYTRLDVIRANLASYSESGSDYWALAYGGINSTTYTGALGSRMAYEIPMSWGNLTPNARLEYEHAFGGGYDQSLSYADLPGSSYSLPGTDLTRDLATGGVGLRAETTGLRVDLEYLVSGWPREGVGQEIRATVMRTF